MQRWAERITLVSGLVILVVAIACCLSGCSVPGQPVATSNPAMHVELMFEQDGVKVYRFRDAGYDHYYADARGSISGRQPAGKTTRPDGLVTADTTRFTY